jgi:hypothetical protein
LVIDNLTDLRRKTEGYASYDVRVIKLETQIAMLQRALEQCCKTNRSRSVVIEPLVLKNKNGKVAAKDKDKGSKAPKMTKVKMLKIPQDNVGE